MTSDTLLTDLALKDFCATTASAAPAPGGGSVSALLGALGAALAEMVAHLSSGAAENASEMHTLALSAEGLRGKLLALISEDAKSFDAVMAAFQMPKESEAEKAARKARIQEALKHATVVPFLVAETAAEIFPLARVLIEKGNPNALSDAMVCALSARSAVLGAALNVRINLGSVKDAAFVAQFKEGIQELEARAREAETQLLTIGYHKLNKE